MEEEVTWTHLKLALGKTVEIHAFGRAYVGKLTKVSPTSGLIRVEDKEDYVLLEMERIDAFAVVGRKLAVRPRIRSRHRSGSPSKR